MSELAGDVFFGDGADEHGRRGNGGGGGDYCFGGGHLESTAEEHGFWVLFSLRDFEGLFGNGEFGF